MSAKIAVRYAGDIVIIDVWGRITLGEGAGMLRRLIRNMIKAGELKLLINLRDVSYLDSAAIGELVGAYATVANLGGAIKLLNPQGRVSEVLAVTKLYTVFETFSDEAAAIASFQTGAAAAG